MTTTHDINSLLAAIDGGDLGVLPILADALQDDTCLHLLGEQVRAYHRRRGDPLAAGWLARWARLACRPKDGEQGAAFGAEVAQVSWLQSQEDVLDWAGNVLALAEAIDGLEERPDAGAEPVGSTGVHLWWDGRATAGRQVDLWLESGPEGLRLQLEWDTGTGRASTFLGWPDRTALAGYEAFGPLNHERQSDVILDATALPAAYWGEE